ncbi:MAG: hypothetical protein JRJ15_14910 [Deltaproteobacteria bacterium]|nr:hypothetical protein [Deltaproteobacteria bacterium]
MLLVSGYHPSHLPRPFKTYEEAGEKNAYEIIKMEKILETAARLHPKSFMIARKKTENEYQIPNVIPRVTNAIPTMTQP